MNHPGFPANNKGRRRSNSFAISPHLGGSSSWLEGHLRKGVLTSGEGTWRDGAGGGEAYTRFNQQGLLSGWICDTSNPLMALLHQFCDKSRSSLNSILMCKKYFYGETI
nr:uncharacterized protein LOC116765312 [Danaus plexippus plexippus]